MNARLARTILAIVVGLGVLAVVGVVAYNVGINASNGGHVVLGFGAMRGMVGGRVFGFGGVGLWGLILMVLVVIGIVWLLAVAFGGWGHDHSASPTQPPMASQAPAAGEALDKLSELSAMHDKGALTDEEFTAAKRRLLGL